MIYQVNDGSRTINHESDLDSTIYCNNASIIQNVHQSNSSMESKKTSTSHHTAAPTTTTTIGRTSPPNQIGGAKKSSNAITYNNCCVDRMNETRMTSDIILPNRRRMTLANIQQFKSHCRQQRQTYDLSGDGSDTGSVKSSESSIGSCCSNSSCGGSDESTSSGEPNLPYPGFPEFSMRYLTQDARPRNWCLLLITNPWFERISILVILFNCITLGMYQPCVDDECVTNRCKILQVCCLILPINL